MPVLTHKGVRIVVKGSDETPVRAPKDLVFFLVVCLLVMLSNFHTLSSNTTVTKETFIMLKVFIMRNSALYHLKAHNLPFFHAKF